MSLFNLIKKIIRLVSLIIILILSLGICLLTTQSGLYLALQGIKASLPGQLVFHGLKGNLLQGFSIENLAYNQSKWDITAVRCRIQLNFKQLINKQLIINNLEVDQLNINTSASWQNSLSSMQKPMQVIISNWTINTLDWSHQNHHIIQLNHLSIEGERNNQYWHFKHIEGEYLNTPWHLQGKIETVMPYAVGLDLTLNEKIKNTQAGHFKINGNFFQYVWTGQLIKPFRMTLHGFIRMTSLSSKTTIRGDYFGKNLSFYLESQVDKLNATLQLDKNKLHLQGDSFLHWKAKAYVPKPDLIHPALKGLNTQITGDAELSGTNKGQFNLQFSSGNYLISSSTEDPHANLNFTDGNLRGMLSNGLLDILGKFKLAPKQEMNFKLKIPQFNFNKGLNQSFKGEVGVFVNSLDFLNAILPAKSQVEGQLKALFKGEGLLNSPILMGKIELENARAILPQWGLDLKKITSVLTTKNKKWHLVGSIVADKSQLDIQGQGNLTSSMQGAITIQGNNFHAINTSEYSIFISPKLQLELNPNSLELKGTLLIPEAKVKPQFFANSLTASSDIVLENQKNKQTRLPFTTDIQVEMGDHVAFDVRGIKGLLQGSIQLFQNKNGIFKALGTLQIQNGHYQAYGQDLNIDEGELLFNGGTALNPGIHIRASREIKNNFYSYMPSQNTKLNNLTIQDINFDNQLTLGIEVTGPLKNPKVDLFSKPSTLSQADILSMLILGKPASQASQAGGQLLLAALSSMNFKEGKGVQLVQQLKKIVGVDINVESNSIYDKKTNQLSDETTLVVGKSLSKRLYLSYNFGFTETGNNIVTLSYLLNKFLSLQVNTSANGSGIDLFYTHQKDR